MGDQQNRRFFRIQDRIHFSCRLLGQEPGSPDGAAPSAADPLRDLSSELSRLANEARPMFRRLARESPDAAAAIALLDSKISLLAAAFISRSLGASGPAMGDVSLSASGVGFISGEPLPRDAPVEVTLLLPPTLYRIVAQGRVAYCRVDDGAPGRFWIGVEFSRIDERDREFLTGYVLKRQAAEIKQLREKENGR